MQVAVFRFGPGGRLRGHPGHPQIFAILDGSGEVSGANGNDEPIEAGEAVFLHQGEEHEMKSADGLTALIIEGERLDRFRERHGRVQGRLGVDRRGPRPGARSNARGRRVLPRDARPLRA